MTVLQQIKAIVTENYPVDGIEITDATRLTEDLGLDSLETVELTMFIEEEFDIEITDDDAAKALTIADCVALVCRLAGIPEDTINPHGSGPLPVGPREA